MDCKGDIIEACCVSWFCCCVGLPDWLPGVGIVAVVVAEPEPEVVVVVAADVVVVADDNVIVAAGVADSVDICWSKSSCAASELKYCEPSDDVVDILDSLDGPGSEPGPGWSLADSRASSPAQDSLVAIKQELQVALVFLVILKAPGVACCDG